MQRDQEEPRDTWNCMASTPTRADRPVPALFNLDIARMVAGL